MVSIITARLAAALLVSFICLPAGAQTWSMSGALAAPERTTATSTKITPFFNLTRGAGVKLVPGATGIAVLYLPVTAPDKATFSFMHIRVEGVSKAMIKAELYQQAITGTGLPTRLGALTVAGAPGDGVAMFSGPITARPFDLSKYNYFIRLELCKDGGSDPKLYDVAVTRGRCIPRHDGVEYCPPPPPPWGWACKIIGLP